MPCDRFTERQADAIIAGMIELSRRGAFQGVWLLRGELFIRHGYQGPLQHISWLGARDMVERLIDRPTMAGAA